MFSRIESSARLLFQEPTDVHVFGYTSDASDILRANRFRSNFPEVSMRIPLIERGLTKAACLELLQGAEIRPPAMYALGFQNNNCIPCVKATSPRYWALVRQQFPEHFARMSALSRKLGVRLCLLKKKRIFIDEIPEDHPTTQTVTPSCDFLCHLARELTTGSSESKAPRMQA